MTYFIEQSGNINIRKQESPFMRVDRKYGFKVISQFFKDDKMILETSLVTYFLQQIVKIRYQDLPNEIALVRFSTFTYSLLVNDIELSMKIKYFKRPAFRLYQNGLEVGWIGNPKLIAFEGRNYQMQTEVENDTLDLYFLILFISQLRALS